MRFEFASNSIAEYRLSKTMFMFMLSPSVMLLSLNTRQYYLFGGYKDLCDFDF